MKAKMPFTTIVLLMGTLLFAVWFVMGLLPARVAEDDTEPIIYHSVYLTVENDVLIEKSELDAASIKRVTTYEALITTVEQMPIQVIYFHPIALSDVNPDWLRQRYSEGIVIVAFNTHVSDLGKMVDAGAITVDDIIFEESQGRIGVAALYTKSEPGKSSSNMQLSEYFPDFSVVPQIIRNSFISQST